MSLLFEDLTSASVKALEPTEIFVYFKNDFFLNWLKDNPKLEQEIRAIAERRKNKNVIDNKK
jgi:CRP-like cAMP-binding protein